MSPTVKSCRQLFGDVNETLLLDKNVTEICRLFTNLKDVLKKEKLEEHYFFTHTIYLLKIYGRTVATTVMDDIMRISILVQMKNSIDFLQNLVVDT